MFLLGVGVNFKPLLKTLTCVSVRHVLHNFRTLGWIIVCLFDWCDYNLSVKQKIICVCTIWLLIFMWFSSCCFPCAQSSFILFIDKIRRAHAVSAGSKMWEKQNFKKFHWRKIRKISYFVFIYIYIRMKPQKKWELKTCVSLTINLIKMSWI